MRIDGIVTCVGRKYADILHRSLPLWVDTLDSVTIVTDSFTSFNPPYGVEFFRTDLFTKYGAYFNKGAALSSAYVRMNAKDWVLHFDADTIPPANWRRLAEPIIEVGHLYGCQRVYSDGKPIHDPPPFPYGFFHLWNVKDPKCWVRPLWDLFWPSAGHYEISFIERWPSIDRVRLPFSVVHPCEPRQGWFGESPAGRVHMERDIRTGHHLSRINKEYVLKVPAFKNNLIIKGYTYDSVLVLLQKRSTIDPFDTAIQVIG